MTRLDPMSPLSSQPSPGRSPALPDAPPERGDERSSYKSASGLFCPIGLFQREEAEIESATGKINAAFSSVERALHARTIVEATKLLTSCTHFDPASLHCRLCRNFSNLRAKTAELLIQAGSSVAMTASEGRHP
ncbi:MAG: hypothetical protein ACLQIQ_04445 [Beijerinckiaceae bacterium]